MDIAQLTLTTERLVIRPLAIADAGFILELLNTDGWKMFIGNRNVVTHTDAEAYIQRIMANADTVYWVALLSSSKTPIGLVTLIKRDYLPHSDIGFAFLPEYNGQGYAYEATLALIDKLSESGLKHLLAITIPENTASITLLKKLGFVFERRIQQYDEVLQVHAKYDSGSLNSLNTYF